MTQPDPNASIPRQPAGKLAEDETVRVAHDRGAVEEARVVPDSFIGERVEHLRPVAGPLPPQEASAAAERGDIPAEGPPVQDVKEIPPRPSVWDASGEGGED